MYIKYFLFFIFLAIFLPQCKPSYLMFYENSNKAMNLIVSEDYKGALKIYDKSLKYNQDGLLHYNLNAYMCAIKIHDSLKQVKYYKLLTKTINCNQYLFDLKQLSTFKLNSLNEIKSKNEKPNYYYAFIDSLFNADQENRTQLPGNMKRQRDSLNLIIFNKFISKHGFPSQIKTNVYCHSSGTGIDSYKLNILLNHFKELNNFYLDSVLIENFEILKIENHIVAKYCNTIQDYTRYGSLFFNVNDTLYIGKKMLEKVYFFNKNRRKYRLPSVKEELILIKNFDKLKTNGFVPELFSYKINSNNFPKENFISVDQISIFK